MSDQPPVPEIERAAVTILAQQEADYAGDTTDHCGQPGEPELYTAYILQPGTRTVTVPLRATRVRCAAHRDADGLALSIPTNRSNAGDRSGTRR
jgi:hypothetical protein